MTLGPKEVHMQLVDEAYVEFEEKHGRPPTRNEEYKIAYECMLNLHEHYADIADRLKMERQ